MRNIFLPKTILLTLFSIPPRNSYHVYFSTLIFSSDLRNLIHVLSHFFSFIFPLYLNAILSS